MHYFTRYLRACQGVLYNDFMTIHISQVNRERALPRLELVARLRANGLTYAEIGKRLRPRVSRQRVMQLVHRARERGLIVP